MLKKCVQRQVLPLQWFLRVRGEILLWPDLTSNPPEEIVVCRACEWWLLFVYFFFIAFKLQFWLAAAKIAPSIL